ncbi:ComEC/Rec2 family competence protein, partial [Aegicerativicinus sediminis]
MNAIKYPLIRITLSLIIGIAISSFVTINLIISSVLCSTLFVALLIVYSKIKQNRKFQIVFDFLFPLQFIAVGILLIPLQSDKAYANFIGNKEFDANVPSIIQFEVDHRLKPTQYYERYLVNIEYLNTSPCIGNAILRIHKSDSSFTLPRSSTGIITSILKQVPTPSNPGSFNYQQYLEKKEIYYQITTNYDSISIKKVSDFSIASLADRIRNSVKSKFKNKGLNKEQLAITSALLLGEREDISPELSENYAAAGAIHLLAISGLHIGIIFLFLSIILKPLNRLGKKGTVIRSVIIILLLWGFAIISGLSPSVVRAVTMFSLLAFATLIKRNPNTINVISISALILLSFNARLFYDVGFQLSYLAVLGIVIIQPRLFKWLRTKNKILNYFIGLITVSLAAQLAVLPLSLYYFHQFPTLFILSNLILIPLVTIILMLGILLTVILLVSTGIENYLVKFFGKLIDVMNSVVGIVAEQEEFILNQIPFTTINLITLFFLIGSLVYLLYKRSFLSITLILISIILVQIGVLLNRQLYNKDELVIFQVVGETLITKKENREITGFTDSLTEYKQQIFESYKLSQSANSLEIDSVPTVFKIKGTYLLKIDTSNVWIPLENLHSVLLTHSPRINLDRLIDSLQPERIIADGSNYFRFVNKWEETCRKRKLPFHAT